MQRAKEYIMYTSSHYRTGHYKQDIYPLSITQPITSKAYK